METPSTYTRPHGLLAASEPRHAARRARRRPGARARLRQPRLPARRRAAGSAAIYNGRRWIACRLEFRGWLRRPLLQPGRFTELFFLDEATAMAAGHRACALCRREDYVRLGEIWRSLHPADEERTPSTPPCMANVGTPRRGRAAARGRGWTAAGRDVRAARRPALPGGRRTAAAWSAGGYSAGVPRPAGGRATVITPPSLVGVLRAGWRPLVPLLHPSAHATSSSPPHRSAP